MRIEFVPHIGKVRVTHKGRDEHKLIQHNQDQIILDGKRAAYVGHEPGSPICFIRRYPDFIREAIEAAVLERCKKPSKSHQPPKPSPDVAVAEIERDNETDDEELEDEDDGDEQFD